MSPPNFTGFRGYVPGDYTTRAADWLHCGIFPLDFHLLRRPRSPTCGCGAWEDSWGAVMISDCTRGHRPISSRDRLFAEEIVGWSLRTGFLRRSTARGGQSRNHTHRLERIRHTAICGKSVHFGRRSQDLQGTQRAFPHARYIGACEKGRERRRGGARAVHALSCTGAYARPRHPQA